MLRVNSNNSSIGLFKSVDASLDISDVHVGPLDVSSGFQEEVANRIVQVPSPAHA
jgi:hypothetical protein